MFITVSNNEAIPLYEQIERQIIAQIVSGDMKPGTILPSIRALAKELMISVITVKKAYEHLETGGYILTRAGKESIITDTWAQLLREAKTEKIQQYFIAGIDECRLHGMKDDEILQKFTMILERKQGE